MSQKPQIEEKNQKAGKWILYSKADYLIISMLDYQK